MKKLIIHIFCVAVAAALAAACTNDPLEMQNPANDYHCNDDGSVTLAVGLCFPELQNPASRALADKPVYENLDLYLLVFEKGRDLVNIAQPDEYITQPDDDGVVKYKVTLPATDNETVIHLIAIDNNAENPLANLQWGSEYEIIPQLYTTDGTDAYWQRVELGSGIHPPKYDDEGNKTDDGNLEIITAALTRVPMIRNFARVSVDAQGVQGVAGTFTFEGFTVVNTRDRGYIAPYNAVNQKFIDFTHPQNEAEVGYYNYITGQGYLADRYPEGSQLKNTTAQLSNSGDGDGWDWSPEPKYFYERQFISTNHTFVIIKGRWNGTLSYYKLDLGRKDSNTEIFSYYNLLRNIDYHIVLKSVGDAGYASPAAAAAGIAFNNISADVQTRNMLNISDGIDILYVNFTTRVIVDNTDYPEFRFQYRTNMNGGKGTQSNRSVVHNNETIGIKEGNVIADWGYYDTPGDESTWHRYEVKYGTDDWASIVIKPKTVTAQQQTQTFTIYGDDGTRKLSREITLISRTPWAFENMDTFPGLYEDFEQVPWDWSETAREIGQFVGSPLTLFFELPAGLPEAMFPLQFVIESDKQNIENAYVGNAVVQSATSTFTEDRFDDDGSVNTNKGQTRIQYVKTVQWADYDTSNPENTSASRIVRVRFYTITDLRQDGVGEGNANNSQSITRLRVTNPYFVTRDDKFTRSAATSDPSPRFWNFSSPMWSSVITTLADNHTRLNNNNTITVDDLTLTEGANNSMSSGSYTYSTADSDEDVVYSYIRTSNANDNFVHNHEYPGSAARQIRINVMATNNNNVAITNQNGVSVTVSGTGGSGNITGPTFELDNSTIPFPTLCYTYEVPSTVTEVSVTVKPASATATRFYNIEFFPRWDESTNP